jgi:hypothetical protein
MARASRFGNVAVTILRFLLLGRAESVRILALCAVQGWHCDNGNFDSDARGAGDY